MIWILSRWKIESKARDVRSGAESGIPGGLGRCRLDSNQVTRFNSNQMSFSQIRCLVNSNPMILENSVGSLIFEFQKLLPFLICLFYFGSMGKIIIRYIYPACRKAHQFLAQSLIHYSNFPFENLLENLHSQIPKAKTLSHAFSCQACSSVWLAAIF